jgi:hypothetical protein
MMEQTLARGSAGKLLSIPALVVVGLASAASALARQDLAAERSRVLGVVGKVNAVDVPLFPLSDDVGFVATKEIVESQAKSLRLHFVIERAGEAWGIRIRDEAGNVVWSTWDGATSGDEFWSDEIAGKKAVIELHSSRPANLVKFRVDEIAVGEDTDTQVSITGANQLTSIVGLDPWIVDLGESVVRLRFIGDDGKAYVCTGFLVTSELMLTNQHCISSRSEMISALVDFDFDRDGHIGRTLRLRELLQSDFGLDYSVVRLSQPVGRTPLELDTARPADGAAMMIIQHPGGEPKQVSLADCEVDGPLVRGRGGVDTDFAHLCDTKGGSSGSPVFRRDSRKVVGLHHLGFRSGSPELFNRSIHIDLILQDMDPALRREILEGQP